MLLNDDLLAIYSNLGCLQALAGSPGPASAVLRRSLTERNSALFEELFYLLAAIRHPAAVATVARSLRSPLPEARANAAEALESLTSSQMAALMGPLFEPDLQPGPQLTLAKQTWDLSFPTPAAALRQLLSDASDTWLRTLAAAALAEQGSSASPTPDTDFTELLRLAQADPDPGVRAEASHPAARLAPAGAAAEDKNGAALTLVEKLILIENVPFFQNMTVEQLRVLASACEEIFFPAETRLYKVGDPGGTLYIVVSGCVSIE